MNDAQSSGAARRGQGCGQGRKPAGPEPVTRRKLIAWLTGGSLAAVSLLASGQLARFLSFRPATDAAETVTAGSPTELRAGALLYHAAARAYLGRDEGGLYAIDAVCTHLGCLVEHAASGGFVCPCHGSRFGHDGRVQNGPASQPLRYLNIRLSAEGEMVVDRGRQVAPETRLVIPS